MKKLFVLAVAAMLLLSASGAEAVSATSSQKSQSAPKAERPKDNQVSSSTVSAEAREIRGWSDAQKVQFLTTVKSHAQLKSGQDLENFAKGVMLKDENVSGAEADDERVEVRYKLPAKFLGIFATEIDAIAEVTFEKATTTGRGPKEVSVKFPWYQRFFSLDSAIRAEILREALNKRVQTDAQVPRDNSYAQNGVTIQLISSILKGIRAELSKATATAAKKTVN